MHGCARLALPGMEQLHAVQDVGHAPLAAGQGHHIAMTGGTAAFDLQGHQNLADDLRSFLAHIVRLTRHHAAHASFGRAVVFIEVMSVQGQARLKAQGVARAKTHGLHALVGQQGFPEVFCLAGGQIEFVAQFACVACAAHQHGHALPLRFAEGEVTEVMKVLAHELFEHVQRFRALQVHLASIV